MHQSPTNAAPASIEKLQEELAQIGVRSGDALMVHASLRSVGAIEGRGQGLITALLNSVGERGTLMAYASFELTAELPHFDPNHSRARPQYGVFAELVRTSPGAFRSGNPGASMVAIGAQAQWLCENHPLSYGYGPEGPLGKFVSLGGKVLLLGSDPDQVTLLHLAEHLARIPNRRVVQRQVDLLQADGSLGPIVIEEFDTSHPVVSAMPEKIFAQIVGRFIESGAAAIGQVGRAQAHLLPADALVSFAVRLIEHEYGGA
jgi:aminoglycoside 3-N-acetyltransferase